MNKSQIEDPWRYMVREKISGRKYTVHIRDRKTRFEEAGRQLELFKMLSSKKKKNQIKLIVEATNSYLRAIGIDTVAKPKVKIDKLNNNEPIPYSNIKEKYKLSNEKDIIWMKFAKASGLLCLVCVASSNDVNHRIPSHQDQYYLRNPKGTRPKWKWNTSGIIVHNLGLEYDDSFVLVFPLSNLSNNPSRLTKEDVELGIGEYLLSQGIPILDRYSHRKFTTSK